MKTNTIKNIEFSELDCKEKEKMVRKSFLMNIYSDKHHEYEKRHNEL